MVARSGVVGSFLSFQVEVYVRILSVGRVDSLGRKKLFAESCGIICQVHHTPPRGLRLREEDLGARLLVLPSSVCGAYPVPAYLSR